MYREDRPSPQLTAFVECYWSRQARLSVPTRQRVLPDGCIDLLVAVEHKELTVRLVGPMSRARLFDCSPRSYFLGVRFRPGGAAALLGIHSRDFRDELPAVEEVGGLQELTDRVQRPGRNTDRLRWLDQFLADRIAVAEPEGLGFARFFSSLSGDSRRWCAQSGYSDRQLRRLFDRWVGLGPRQFCRIVRFKRLLALLPEESSLARAAAGAGYCDQPHMNRDVRQLTGLSPAALKAGNCPVEASATGTL